MNAKHRQTFGARTALIVVLATSLSACTQTQNESKTSEVAIEPVKLPVKETRMTSRAIGPFEVKLQPVGDVNKGDGSSLGRMTIDKQFHGDLEANSKGEMLSAMTDTKGSAGYVAIERVTGKLSGKSGSFVLQHNAIMDRGTPSLNIVVVPDSGSGELVGLIGTMKIIIEGGKHSYEFEYALPQSK